MCPSQFVGVLAWPNCVAPRDHGTTRQSKLHDSFFLSTIAFAICSEVFPSLWCFSADQINTTETGRPQRKESHHVSEMTGTRDIPFCGNRVTLVARYPVLRSRSKFLLSLRDAGWRATGAPSGRVSILDGDWGW